MIDSIKQMDCTGCKMCKDICPVDAIYYECDREGFWYPKVNYDKCIKCGKCVRTCPSLSERKNQQAKEPEVYAAWALDDEIRLKSTSGGIFYILAEKVLQQDGIIAACKYTDDFKSAYHTMGDTNEDLEAFKGSKYFQSDTEGIYKSVGEQLKNGRKVLFCGAPCQVAGLNNYIGKMSDNLITVDFICRGINSPMVFKKYVEDCERYHGSPVKIVHLKNKNKGWTRLGTYMEFQNGKTYYRDKITDPWVNGFVRGDLFMRPCCSECKYKEKIRVADITIGDFWGLKGSQGDLFKGISVVLINTDKGAAYLKTVSDKLFLEKHTYDEASKGNGCLLSPAPMGIHRKEFFDKINNTEFESLVWELLGETKYSILLKQFKNKVKALLGR
jgi:coenzyme F420-reducing hydrogenase beta subunit